MTKINYFREDLAKLLSKYDAELSIDDKGNPAPTPLWKFEQEVLQDPRIATTKFAERNIYQKGMDYLKRMKLA